MNISDRFCHPVSDAELTRRRSAVRDTLTQQGVDALLVHGAHSLAGGGGFARWLFGRAAETTKPNILILPKEGLMTLICHGAFDTTARYSGEQLDLPGVDRVRFTPSVAAVSYTGCYEGELVADELRLQRFNRVGLVGGLNMPYGLLSTIKARCPEVTLIDLDDELDPIRAIKSSEEIALMRQAAAMQDEIFQTVLGYIKPGMHDYEVMSYSHYQGQLAGSETGYFLGSSAAPGHPTDILGRQLQGRRIQAGDLLLWQSENTGPGGMFTHMARLISLGPVAADVDRLYGAMIEAQAFTAERLMAGASSSRIFADYNDHMASKGFPKETRLHCHGQGYDVVERPLIRSDETMPIAANMNIGIHPSVKTGTMFVTVCDNFLTQEAGPPERLHKTPQKIFEI